MKLALRTAVVCGALPLIVGVTIFVLWLVTRWDWLMTAGFITICGGIAIVLIGALALARFWWLAVRMPDLSHRRPWRSIAVCGILLLSNFPVAAGIMVTVAEIESNYTVVVRNASEETLVNVRVAGGGCDEVFGSIPPGADIRRTLRFECDGRLEFWAQGASNTYAETIDGYVTGNLGGRSIVTVHRDGTISVRDGD